MVRARSVELVNTGCDIRISKSKYNDSCDIYEKPRFAFCRNAFCPLCALKLSRRHAIFHIYAALLGLWAAALAFLPTFGDRLSRFGTAF